MSFYHPLGKRIFFGIKSGKDKMRILFIVMLLISLFYASSFAQTGTISGYVKNGSADSTIIANAEVNLLVNRGHHLIDDSSYVQKTDAKGRFEFTDLKIDSTLLYYPRSTFGTIVYYGRAVRLTENMSAAQSDVVVYDTTSSPEKIVMQLEHLFIDAEPGRLSFREIFIMNNSGTQTFVGRHFDQPDQHYVLQFPLPDGFDEVEILTPEAQNLVRMEGGTLYHTELMSPGTRQFSYRFIVPSKKKEWQFSRPIFYPSGAVNIFISNPDLTIEGPGITAMGEFSIRGTNYQRYSAFHLMPGTELIFIIKNIPGRSFSFSIQWLVLAGVIILLAVGFIYTLRKSKS